MINNIRPYQLFNLVQSNSYNERLVKIVLPTDKTPVMLETSVILSLLKIVYPKQYFEIGTYLGIELLNVAANTSDDVMIFTLDLDPESFKKAEQLPIDKQLSVVHFDNINKLAFMNTPYEHRIKQLYGDSTLYDFTAFNNQIDFVYVDGGHDYRTVKIDTENALKILSKNRKACILWHDYDSKDYPDVTKYIQEIASKYEIFVVGSTRHCFYLNEFCSEYIEKLKK